MRRKIILLAVSCFLTLFSAFLSFADNPHIFNEMESENGETENEQDNLPDSQDIFESSHVDDKVFQDTVATEEMSPVPEESSLEESSSESLEESPEGTVPDAPEETSDVSVEESLAQYYKEYRESLDRLLDYRMEEDLQETEYFPVEEDFSGNENQELLLLFLIFAFGVTGGLLFSLIMWGRI